MAKKIKTIVCPKCGWLGKLVERYFQYSCSCGNTWVLDSKMNVVQGDVYEEDVFEEGR